ncbi:MAG: hypothetical protein N3A54_02965 [Patescibacteria group bacterium]|nr:hypothetical protein [Patescibacteria group bacterium]
MPYMKIIIFVFVFLFILNLFPSIKIHASSEQAYKDYLYQSDIYREKYNEFSIAKNEYLKFKTLTAETSAVVKTREMLAQRANLLRAYLLLLEQKLNESSVNEKDRALFQTLIQNQIKFLENHARFVESIATLKDAIKANGELESQYLVFSTSIRQIIIGLTEAKLIELSNDYSSIMITTQLLIEEAKRELPSEYHGIIERWFQRISDKRILFLQKLDTIQKGRLTLQDRSFETIEKKFQETLSIAQQARQELKDGLLHMKELMNEMKYKK